MKLTDTRILVTGGASGMGRAFVEELVSAGAKVAFCDIDADRVQEAAAATGAHGIRADVSSESDVAAMFAEAVEVLGGLNALVNNAGIFRDGLLVKKNRDTGEVTRMSLKQWNQVIDVDLTGPFLCTRELATHCLNTNTRPAVVVNISSIARHGNPGQSNYSAAKAGLVADTRLWAVELARHGIRVGAVAPGFVRTPILEGMRPDVLERMTAGVPLRRVAEPFELWQAVRFILECDYFTGRCIDVDGGLSL